MIIIRLLAGAVFRRGEMSGGACVRAYVHGI